MIVKFKKLHPDAVIPERKSKGAACMDVVATRIEHKSDNEVIYYLGFSTEFSEEWKACMIPRSGFRFTGWVMTNTPGHIDSDFRGEWQFGIKAIPMIIWENGDIVYPDVPYKVGDRVAQIYFQRVEDVQWEEAKELEESERGEGGFGHTGLN